MIGQTLSHYRILERLGEGGMGVVYKAVDSRLGREVAVKVLAAEAMGDPERKRRFIQEARTASALNHPNIVTIHDIGTAEVEGRAVDFIAMEYVRGKTLYQLIGPHGLGVAEALRAAIQVADALAAAHAAGIVHRDLKPANIMVTEQGLVKVLDFGVAKLTDPVETDPNAPTQTLDRGPRTTEGTVVGTVAFMSPEQAEGKRVDARSDIFSFGSVFYEMLTGQRAFEGDSRLSVLASILRDEPGPGGALAAAVPAEIEPILARCLRKDPARRFQSAADLKVVLQELWDRKLVEKMPSSTAVHPVRERAARRPPPWRAIGAAAVVVAAALLVWWLPAVRERLAARLPFLNRIPAQKQIAVLGFQNVGGEAANQAFCDGLVETLTSKLTQLEQFHGSVWVAPASEVRRGQIVSAQDARRALGVNLVITGSVQRSDRMVRVTANLVDAVTLRQLGARTLDTRLEDLATLQDGVVKQVAGLLDLEVHPQARQVLSGGGTLQGTAYDSYVQGYGALQRYDRSGSLEQAVALFQRATQQDPNYAEAFAALGQAYLTQFRRTREPKWLEQARSAGRRALQIDDRIAAAHINAGAIGAATGQTEEALREFQRALELDPVSARAYREMAAVYETAGRYKEAEATCLRAVQLRPSDWLGYTTLGVFYTRRARYPEAEAPFRRVTELTPDNPVAFTNLGGVYHLMGRYDDAIRALERSVAIRPTATAVINLGTIYFFQGRYADAVKSNEKAIELAGPNHPSDYVLWGNLADSYRWTPELADRAPAAYRKAIELTGRHLEVNPNLPRVVAARAVYWAKLAGNEQALADITRARRLDPTDTSVGFKAVLVYELVHQRDRALAALEKVLQSGYSIEEVRREPELAQLRRDPRCERMLASR